MKKLLFSLLFLSVWMWCNIGGLLQKPTIAMTKTPTKHESVVSITGLLGQCTGFIAKDSFVVTAAHCVPFNMPYIITFHDGSQIYGYIEYVDADDDWAILKTYTKGLPGASLNSDPMDWGALLHHIRYITPDGQLQSNGIYVGTECELPVAQECYHYVALAGVPGDSGGPVFNDKGEVVGIMSASYWPVGAPLSLIVPVGEAVEWLTAH